MWTYVQSRRWLGCSEYMATKGSEWKALCIYTFHKCKNCITRAAHYFPWPYTLTLLHRVEDCWRLMLTVQKQFDCINNNIQENKEHLFMYLFIHFPLCWPQTICIHHCLQCRGFTLGTALDQKDLRYAPSWGDRRQRKRWKTGGTTGGVAGEYEDSGQNI